MSDWQVFWAALALHQGRCAGAVRTVTAGSDDGDYAALCWCVRCGWNQVILDGPAARPADDTDAAGDTLRARERTDA